jgi:hypothetical protein
VVGFRFFDVGSFFGVVSIRRATSHALCSASSLDGSLAMPDNSGPPVANVVAYVNLLEEVKLRIEAIDAVITGETR